MIYAILEEIDAAGFFPIVAYDMYEKIGIKKIEELIANGNIAGVMIVNREYFSDIDHYLKDLQIPHIYMHYFNRNSSEEINIIDVNHVVGGFVATKHLLNLGHRKILAVTSPGREFKDRTTGFKRAMKDAGMDLSENDIISIEHNYDAGYEFARDHRLFINRYSAVFVENDLAAIGFINALQDAGLKVPGDISVIGYDDIDAGRLCRPALTTVRQPVRDLAKAGIKRITDIIATGDTSQLQTYIQPKLVIRGSTASL